MKESSSSAVTFDKQLNGCAVSITIKNRKLKWPSGVKLAFVREDRTPSLVWRSPWISRRGQGRLLCWVPKGAVAVKLINSDGSTYDRDDLHITRPRRVSLLELGIRVFLKIPRKLAAVLQLVYLGNQRGLSFRFARAVDELNALPYTRWVKMHDRYLQAVREADGYHVTVLVTLEGDAASDNGTLSSLHQQTWSNWRVVEREMLPHRRSMEDQHLLWLNLPDGTVLAPDFLQHMVQPFRSPDVAVVYCDEDVIGHGNRRHSPFFKPAWTPLLARSGWLPLDGALVRLSTVPSGIELGVTSIKDTVTAIATSSGSNIVQLPRVLMSRQMARPLNALSIKPRPALAPVELTVIIPTRDRKDLLLACIDGLKNRTAHTELDIIIVDNDSSDKETLRYFDLLARNNIAEIVHMPGSFNFARACNIGVERARYDRILLLNNDVDPINPDWLAQMDYELSDPDVGAVGAYLLYPDGLVQHAGVTLGAGSVARHSFSFVHPNSGEDKGLLSQRRDVSAVTAACLLTSKSLWKAVGGMDEENLAVAFNDVDYCLKVRRMHKRIIWTPHARLWHRESVSRGKDDTPEKLLRFAREEATMHRRWGSVLANDPFHNPNLSKVAEEFVLEAFPATLAPRTSSWAEPSDV